MRVLLFFLVGILLSNSLYAAIKDSSGVLPADSSTNINEFPFHIKKRKSRSGSYFKFQDGKQEYKSYKEIAGENYSAAFEDYILNQSTAPQTANAWINGKLAIGTSTFPSVHNLDVNGSANISMYTADMARAALSVTNTHPSGKALATFISDTYAGWVGMYGTAFSDASLRGTMSFGSTHNLDIIADGNNVSGGTTKSIIFKPSGYSASAEKARITPTGLFVGYTESQGDYIAQFNGGILLGGNKTVAPTGVNGGMYYNSTTNRFQSFQNGRWTNLVTTDDNDFIRNGTTPQAGNFNITGDGTLRNLGASWLGASNGIWAGQGKEVDYPSPGASIYISGYKDGWAAQMLGIHMHNSATTANETEPTSGLSFSSGVGNIPGYATAKFGWQHLQNRFVISHSLVMGGHLTLGNLATAPTGTNGSLYYGSLYYNSTTNQFSGYRNGGWKNFLMEGDVAMPTAADFIQNQNTSAQPANAWINGKLAIGTTSFPSVHSLDVKGEGNFTFNTTDQNEIHGLTLQNLAVGHSYAGLKLVSEANSGTPVVGRIISAAAESLNYGQVKGLTFSVPANTMIGFRTGPVQAAGTASAPTMVLTTDERVGIRNANPAYTLDINGNIRIGSLLGTGNRMVITNDNGVLSTQEIPTLSSNTWLLGGNSATNPATHFIGTSDSQPLVFKTNGAPVMHITTGGLVTIGTDKTPAGYKLAVGGNILAEKVKVQLQSSWPDYVFSNNYKLLSLKELEAFIKSNQHLPEVPSAEEVKKEGLDVGGNQAILLKKIEELTLYVIEQNKKIETLAKEVDLLKKEQKQK